MAHGLVQPLVVPRARVLHDRGASLRGVAGGAGPQLRWAAGRMTSARAGAHATHAEQLPLDGHAMSKKTTSDEEGDEHKASPTKHSLHIVVFVVAVVVVIVR